VRSDRDKLGRYLRARLATLRGLPPQVEAPERPSGEVAALQALGLHELQSWRIPGGRAYMLMGSDPQP
jgi:hypothetical protein